MRQDWPRDFIPISRRTPPSRNVRKVWRAFKAAGADYLIAIGGGSSLDTAKASVS